MFVTDVTELLSKLLYIDFFTFFLYILLRVKDLSHLSQIEISICNKERNLVTELPFFTVTFCHSSVTAAPHKNKKPSFLRASINKDIF